MWDYMQVTSIHSPYSKMQMCITVHPSNIKTASHNCSQQWTMLLAPTFSHLSMHMAWYSWKQGSILRFSPSSYSDMQMWHSDACVPGRTSTALKTRLGKQLICWELRPWLLTSPRLSVSSHSCWGRQRKKHTCAASLYTKYTIHRSQCSQYFLLVLTINNAGTSKQKRLSIHTA